MPENRPAYCERKHCKNVGLGLTEVDGVRWLVCEQHAREYCSPAEIERFKAEQALKTPAVDLEQSLHLRESR